MASKHISCNVDHDCPTGQYCYISNLCVDFVECISYNRYENTQPARDALQCGGCLEGFKSKPLMDGTTKDHCIAVHNSGFTLSIYIPILILILVTSVICVTYFLKKRKRQEVMLQQVNTFEPSAPSEESRTHNESDMKREIYQVFTNNNEKNTVEEKLQSACPFRAPNYVENANFPGRINNAGLSAQRNTIPQVYLVSARNDPDAQEQLTILIPRQTIEHEDNVRNVARIQTDSLSCDDDASNTNPTESATAESDDENENRNGEDGKTIKTVLINQNIMMNLNMSN